jgi:predicted RNA methylase
VGKFGAAASAMFFTRTGLEQATRGLVARRRAERLAGAGAQRVADLGCGIGADALAFARAGLSVLAVEADPDTAAVARANTAGLDVSVIVGDATTVDLGGVDAAFCDPARRTAGGRRVFSTAGMSPPWGFVAGLPTRVPRTVLKLAPGLDHGLIPPGAEAEWVSVDGDLVEATVWAPTLAEVPRRATVLTSAGPGESGLTGPGTVPAPVGTVRRYLYDPDGAVTRAGLVAEFAATVAGNLADPSIAFVYSDTATVTPFARRLEVVDFLPVAVKRLRAALRERGIGRLEIRKRGSALDVERLRRDLRLAGDGSGVLVLTRVANAPTALLCRAPEPPEDDPPRQIMDSRRAHNTVRNP